MQGATTSLPLQDREKPLPETLLQTLGEALGQLPPPTANAADIPPTPGTYLLLIRLRAPLSLQGRFAGITLPAGWHVYAGSARGPGGLRARLGRHLARRKHRRWHVDQLTTVAETVRALPFPDTETAPAPGECALAQALLSSGSFEAPVPGFGSSDCRACPAHLLRWNG